MNFALVENQKFYFNDDKNKHRITQKIINNIYKSILEGGDKDLKVVKHKLIPYKNILSNRPNIDLLSNNAPVGMIIIRADNMKIIYVLLNGMIYLPFSEHMIISMMGQ